MCNQQQDQHNIGRYTQKKSLGKTYWLRRQIRLNYYIILITIIYAGTFRGFARPKLKVIVRHSVKKFLSLT